MVAPLSNNRFDSKAMRTATIFLFLLIATLTACAAVDAYKDYKADSERKADESRISIANTSCQKFGFKQGTDSYAACLQNEVNAMLNRDAIQKAAREAESVIPKTTTCTKTLSGMDCTTR